jgi:hypothetical protein
MGRKYITNQQDINYVYPNNVINQYDVEIVHDINNNCVTGTVTNFSGSSFSATGLTVTFNYTWNLNGAERMLNISDTQTIIMSVHAMNTSNNIYGTSQGYLSPWRMVYFTSIPNVNDTTASGSINLSLTPAAFGLATFPTPHTGFEFEIRMISRNCVLPICQTTSF